MSSSSQAWGHKPILYSPQDPSSFLFALGSTDILTELEIKQEPGLLDETSVAPKLT